MLYSSNEGYFIFQYAVKSPQDMVSSFFWDRSIFTWYFLRVALTPRACPFGSLNPTPEFVIKVMPLWLGWNSSISIAVYNFWSSLQLYMPPRVLHCVCVTYQLAKDLLEVFVQNFEILSLWLPSFLYPALQLSPLWQTGIAISASPLSKTVPPQLKLCFPYKTWKIISERKSR